MKQFVGVVVCSAVFALAGCGSDDGGDSGNNVDNGSGGSTDSSTCVYENLGIPPVDDCESTIAETLSLADEADEPIAIEADSWGNIPSSMQLLPPGAMLCGAMYGADAAGNAQLDSLHSVLVNTTGCMDDVFEFYAEAYGSLGCSYDEDMYADSQIWTCPTDGVNSINIAADPGPASFFLVGLSF